MFWWLYISQIYSIRIKLACDNRKNKNIRTCLSHVDKLITFVCSLYSIKSMTASPNCTFSVSEVLLKIKNTSKSKQQKTPAELLID